MNVTILTKGNQKDQVLAAVKGDHTEVRLFSCEGFVKGDIYYKSMHFSEHRLTNISINVSHSRGRRAEPFDKGSIHCVPHTGSFPESHKYTQTHLINIHNDTK